MGGGGSVIQDAKTIQDKQIDEILRNRSKLKEQWNRLDFNGNGICSLAEIDKFITSVPGFEKFNNKPAIIRAYKCTCKRDGDGDDWVQKREFGALLRNIYYFNKLWNVFDDIDTGDDRRIDSVEFQSGLKKLGIEMSPEQADAEFAKMDANGGGQVLFDEFCKYIARMASGPAVVLGAGEKRKKVKKETNAKEDEKPETDDVVDELDLLLTKNSSKVQKAAEASGVKRKEKKRKEAWGNNAPETARSQGVGKLPAFLQAARTVEDEKLEACLSDKNELRKMWKTLDYNGNGICSLAEIDKMIVSVPGFEKFNNKPALMRAYKRTTSKAGGGDGDDWVEKKEFRALLRNIYYFNKLWNVFDDVDTDDDRRIDAKEFWAGLQKLGVNLTPDEALAEFKKMDANGGGQVLFDEFCVYYGRMASGKKIRVRKPKQKVPMLSVTKGKRPVSRMAAAKASANRRTARFNARGTTRPVTAAGRTHRSTRPKQLNGEGKKRRPYQRRRRARKPNFERLYRTKHRNIRDPNRFKKKNYGRSGDGLVSYHGPKIVTHNQKAS